MCDNRETEIVHGDLISNLYIFERTITLFAVVLRLINILKILIKCSNCHVLLYSMMSNDEDIDVMLCKRNAAY